MKLFSHYHICGDDNVTLIHDETKIQTIFDGFAAL